MEESRETEIPKHLPVIYRPHLKMKPEDVPKQAINAGTVEETWDTSWFGA